jgi:hypothetical protein
MSNLEPYVDAVATGLFLGAGPGLGPNRVLELVGPDFIDDRTGRRLRRDYGLVEFHFDGITRDEITCHGATIQVHRLAGGDQDTVVPRRVRERYGTLERYIDGTELLVAVLNRLGKREVYRDHVTGFIKIHVAGTVAYINEAQGADRVRGAEPGDGDVWSIELRNRQ